MDVIEFYNRMKNASVGLPEWHQLQPMHQHLVVQAVNYLLQVCHDHNVTGKNNETGG
jgi:hypothetical protein